jgi:hypothetical protein
MIRDLANQAATMAAAAFSRELASQLGITHDTIEWAMSAMAVRLAPLVGPTRKAPGCQGCTA